jgi:hypothetical protein
VVEIDITNITVNHTPAYGASCPLAVLTGYSSAHQVGWGIYMAPDLRPYTVYTAGYGRYVPYKLYISPTPLTHITSDFPFDVTPASYSRGQSWFQGTVFHVRFNIVKPPNGLLSASTALSRRTSGLPRVENVAQDEIITEL